MIVAFATAWRRLPRGRAAALAAVIMAGIALLALPSCSHTSAPPPERPLARPKPEDSGSRTPPAGPAQLRPSARESFTVRLQYLQTTQSQDVIASRELLVTAHDIGLRRLPPGTWRVSARMTAPARMAYPVYVKSFEHGETRFPDQPTTLPGREHEPHGG